MLANFIENVDQATTADCLALMAEARRRVRESFGVELVPEVVLLGDIMVSSSRHLTSFDLEGRQERTRRR